MFFFGFGPFLGQQFFGSVLPGLHRAQGIAAGRVAGSVEEDGSLGVLGTGLAAQRTDVGC